MAQMVRQVDYGEKIGQGINASLERLIHEKARKIEEKHAYERNLDFLKGAGIANAEQIAHGSDEQIVQLLKGGSVGSPAQGNSRYNELLSQYTGAGQQPMQQGQQQEIDYENPTPQVYARPEVQDALMKYMQSPEVQQQYTPEQLAKIQQKLQQYAQQGQQAYSQQLMGQQAPQQDQNRLYEQLLAAAPKEELGRLKAIREAKGGAVSDKEQKSIDSKYKEFIKNARASYEQAENVEDLADEILGLLDTGQVESGFTGTIRGAHPALEAATFLNTESRQFIAKTNELVDALASTGKGLPTKFRLQLKQISKPNIGQDTETQLALTKNIKKKAQKLKKPYELINKEIEANGRIPNNLENKVFKDFNSEKEAEESLPNPKEYSDDSVIEVDGVRYAKDESGEWTNA